MNDEPVKFVFPRRISVWFIVGLCACLQACQPQDRRGSTYRTLSETYAEAFRLGCAVNPDMVAGRDTTSQALVVAHFNSITAENAMKAENLNPTPGEFSFEEADAFVDFGLRHDMFVVGHTLVWHNQCPEWFFRDSSGQKRAPKELKQILHDYIRTVAGRYTGRIKAWDVVNEVIGEDGAYRRTNWVEGIGDGDELVRLAFSWAAQYAPDAELYYNDFNAWRPAKRDGIMRMVRMLQEAGIRIDGVGMQGHWGLNYPDNKYIEEAIEAYSGLGVKVMITELDIDVLPLTREGQVIGSCMAHEQFQLEEFKTYLDPYQYGLPADVEALLADRYRELFALFYRWRDKIDRVTTWGLSDDMSWKNDYPVPGRTNYPLLWDRQKQGKKALRAVLEVPAQ